jgi:hypothetical protein
VQFEGTVPTVLDRFIQQAVMQVLQKRWDPTFSQYSYGFRPRRSAHHAVAQAQQYIAQGSFDSQSTSLTAVPSASEQHRPRPLFSESNQAFISGVDFVN